jgi:hypothetical protein
VLVLTDAQLEGLRTLQVRALAEKLHVLGCFGDKPDFSFTSRQSAWLRAALTAWMPPSVSPCHHTLFRVEGLRSCSAEESASDELAVRGSKEWAREKNRRDGLSKVPRHLVILPIVWCI